VSNRQIFSDCLIGTGLPFGERIYKNYLSEIDEILTSSAGIRRLGSAGLDLAYVASGKLDVPSMGSKIMVFSSPFISPVSSVM